MELKTTGQMDSSPNAVLDDVATLSATDVIDIGYETLYLDDVVPAVVCSDENESVGGNDDEDADVPDSVGGNDDDDAPDSVGGSRGGQSESVGGRKGAATDTMGKDDEDEHVPDSVGGNDDDEDEDEAEHGNEGRQSSGAGAE